MASNKPMSCRQNTPKYVDKYTTHELKTKGNNKNLWPENPTLLGKRVTKPVDYNKIEESLDRHVFILPKKTPTKKTSKSPQEIRYEWFQSLAKPCQATKTITNKIVQVPFPQEIKFDCRRKQTGHQLIDVETNTLKKSIPSKNKDLLQAGTFTLGRDENEMMMMESAIRRLTVTVGTKEDKKEVYLPDQLEKVNKMLWELDFPSLKIDDYRF
jgi:hypothetical protein